MQRSSDDPVGAAQLVRVRSALSRIDSYRQILTTVRGDLDSSESILASAEELAIHAHEIAVQGANGATTAEGRYALAQEVSELREQMLSFANTKGAQGYLFAGTLTDAPPFTAAGAFLGNDQPRLVEIAEGEVVQVNISGANAFTAAGGRDVLADLQALESALMNNDQAATAVGVNTIDACRRQILAARIDAGLKADRVATADVAHEQGQVLLAEQQHDIADVDPTQAYSRLVEANNQIEQSLAASRSLLSTLSISRFG
jgi:flagellar hook-associated protein 3 FlgL